MTTIDETMARVEQARQANETVRQMFNNAGWTVDAFSLWRVSAYPSGGGQVITLAAPDWPALQNTVYMFLLGRDAEFAATWGGEEARDGDHD